MLHLESVGLREKGRDQFYPLARAHGASTPQHRTKTRSDDDRERDVRTLCRRIYGSTRARVADVEHATHSLLASVTHGTPIALRGESDLVPIARALHDELFGAQRPFVVCDPRRRDNDGSVRCPPNRTTAADAAHLAVGGSVCVRASRLPHDLNALITSARSQGGTAQLFVCLHQEDPLIDMLCSPIRIPSLACHSKDREKIIEGYIADATRSLGVQRMRISHDSRHSFLWQVRSLPELEKAVRRLVALKSAPNVSRAAASLKIAPVSLNRWVARRAVAVALDEIEYCSSSVPSR